MNSHITLAWLAAFLPPQSLQDATQTPRTVEVRDVQQDNDSWTVLLSDKTRFVFDRTRFRLSRVEIGETVIKPVSVDGEPYRLNNSPSGGKVEEPCAAGGAFSFEVALTNATGSKSATERFTLARLGEAVGYRRQLDTAKPIDPRKPTKQEINTLTFGEQTFEGALAPGTHFDFYGHSTVSESGVTYTLHSFDDNDGSRTWVFRSGLHFMNQAVAMNGQNPALLEVVLVQPKGATALTAGDIIAAYVLKPVDRKALLEAHDPERAKKEAAARKAAKQEATRRPQAKKG